MAFGAARAVSPPALPSMRKRTEQLIHGPCPCLHDLIFVSRETKRAAGTKLNDHIGLEIRAGIHCMPPSAIAFVKIASCRFT